MPANDGFDIVMMGHISLDINVYEGSEEQVYGGAVVYSSAAAARSGAKVLVITRCAPSDTAHAEAIGNSGARVRILGSAATTSIRNVYHSADREKRTVTLLSRADAFSAEEMPAETTRVFHFAGLFVGELPDEMIIPASERAAVALDVQGVLRTEVDGSLTFRDWAEKERYLPHVTYLKTDAAEAAIMTGTDDRDRAVRMLLEMGAREVMITHHTEVILGTGSQIHRAPLTPRNLSGRTGRGDTCFAAYLARRLTHGVEDSLAYAAALVSMKMERPGPFNGTVGDVLRRLGAPT